MKTKHIIVICMTACFVVIMLLGLFYLAVISGAIFSLRPDPPKPEITYGEFPIRVTCEINGEIKVIEDTVVCEFDGFENLGSAGTYRKWKSHLKSGNNSLVFLPIEQDSLTIEVGIFHGSPNYYMGDFEQSKEEYQKIMADDRYREYILWEGNSQTRHSITKEEVWEKYKFKILDIQYSPPIQNTFE